MHKKGLWGTLGSLRLSQSAVSVSCTSGDALLKWKPSIQAWESHSSFPSTSVRSSGETSTSSSPSRPCGSIRPMSKSLLLLRDGNGGAGPSADAGTAPAGNGGLELPFSCTLLAAKTTYEVQSPRVSTRYQIYLTSVHQSVLESRSWLSGEP